MIIPKGGDGRGGQLRDASEPGQQYSGGLMLLEAVGSDAIAEECALADELALPAYQDHTCAPDRTTIR